MLSITAVLGTHEFWLRIWLGAQGGNQFSTGHQNNSDDSAVLPARSEGLGFDLSDFEAQNATLKGEYLR